MRPRSERGRQGGFQLREGWSTQLTGRLAQPGWHEVLLPIESVKEGARQLMAWGAEIEVVEPAALRAQLLLQASQVVALYGGAVSGTAKRRLRKA